MGKKRFPEACVSPREERVSLSGDGKELNSWKLEVILLEAAPEFSTGGGRREDRIRILGRNI